MDINKLRIFLTIVDHGSFNKAAQQLGYTQAGLTYIIDGLEEELGLRLLQRTHRGVKLTEDGSALFAEINKLVRVADTFDATVSARKQCHNDRLNIGAIDTMSIKWLPEAMEMFKEKYPEVNVSTTVGDPFEINGWLNDGVVDIGLAEQYWADAELSWIGIVQDPYFGVFPLNTLDSDTCSINDFENSNFFLFDFKRERNVPIFLKDIRDNVNFKADVLSNPAILTQVSKGRGVTMASALSIDTSLLGNLNGKLEILPIEPRVYRSLGVLLKEEIRSNKVTSHFISCMKEVIRKDNSWQDQYVK